MICVPACVTEFSGGSRNNERGVQVFENFRFATPLPITRYAALHFVFKIQDKQRNVQS